VSAVRAQPQASTPAGERPSFDELYRQGQQINASVRTLTARFTETTSNALLERPLVEHGMLFMERATPRVALRYEGTDRVLVIDGDRMSTVWPSRKIHQTQDIGATRRRVQGYFEDADASELRKVFDIELRETSERPGAREVSMVPKRKEIRETLSRLELWVDSSTALMQAMRMTFSNGDTKLMEFEDVMPNAVLDDAVFTVPE
jgi:outer membrane lipoprotein-sorting protein